MADDLKITIETPEPKLNPSSPDFDPEAYWKAIEDKLSAPIQVSDALKKVADAIKQNVIDNIIPHAIDIPNNIAAAIPIVEIRSDIAVYIQGISDKVQEIAQLTQQFGLKTREKLESLSPYLSEVLQEAQESDPTLADVTPFDVFDSCFDENGQPIRDSVYWPLWERAEQAKAEQAKAEQAEAEADVKQLKAELTIKAAVIEKMGIPVDKVNLVLWRTKPDPDGAIRPPLIDTASQTNRRRGRNADISVSVIFDKDISGAKISKTLTPFDHRIHNAVGTLWNEGKRTITASQIYRAAGIGREGSRPASHDVDRINESLTRMSFARVYIDNTAETTVNKGYPLFVDDAPMLSFVRRTAYTEKGNAVEAAVFLTMEPPLYRFARERKNITAVSTALLAGIPLDKTDANLAIIDYVTREIQIMRNNAKWSRTITLATLFDKCEISSGSQRSRARVKIAKLLDYYAAEQQGFIKGYKMDTKIIEIRP